MHRIRRFHIWKCPRLVTLPMILILSGYNALAAEWQGKETASGGDEMVAYRAPAYFTVNAGQWRKDIRYAILSDHSAAWFGREGVTLFRPKLSVEMPDELPLTGNRTHESTILRFVNPSPQMRVRALDTVATKTHFYLGSDSASWHPSVSNHRTVRYEQVWDGIDIEYQSTAEGRLQQTIKIAPGADVHAIRFRGIGIGGVEMENILKEEMSRATQEHER